MKIALKISTLATFLTAYQDSLTAAHVWVDRHNVLDRYPRGDMGDRWPMEIMRDGKGCVAVLAAETIGSRVAQTIAYDEKLLVPPPPVPPSRPLKRQRWGEP